MARSNRDLARGSDSPADPSPTLPDVRPILLVPSDYGSALVLDGIGSLDLPLVPDRVRSVFAVWTTRGPESWPRAAARDVENISTEDPSHGPTNGASLASSNPRLSGG